MSRLKDYTELPVIPEEEQKARKLVIAKQFLNSRGIAIYDLTEDGSYRCLIDLAVGRTRRSAYLFEPDKLDERITQIIAERKKRKKHSGWPGFLAPGVTVTVTNAAGVTVTGRVTDVGTYLAHMTLANGTTSVFATDADIRLTPDAELSERDFDYGKPKPKKSRLLKWIEAIKPETDIKKEKEGRK